MGNRETLATLDT